MVIPTMMLPMITIAVDNHSMCVDGIGERAHRSSLKDAAPPGAEIAHKVRPVIDFRSLNIRLMEWSKPDCSDALRRKRLQS
jgi:hypothetical protein